MSNTSNRPGSRQPPPEAALAPGRRAELSVFAIIAAFIWPVVAVSVVGGYGFIVWMSQVILGPPGPPGGLFCHEKPRTLPPCTVSWPTPLQARGHHPRQLSGKSW